MKNTSKTIKKDNISTTIFSERWWIITSLIIDNIELLYQEMLDETLLDLSKSVKWGIPFMFPNAWPLTLEEKTKSWFDLPQHWFWRINKWKENIIQEDWKYSQSFNLKNSDNFPFDLNAENIIEINNNVFKTTHIIKNIWENKAPISIWLHPYFRVPNWKKEDIKWDFDWWEQIKSQVNIWWNDGTISFDNPWNPFEISIPELWTLVLEASKDYKKFWVRSLPWKDFVCIEPVEWEEWAILNSPVLINPWKENISFLKINLKK